MQHKFTNCLRTHFPQVYLPSILTVKEANTGQWLPYWTSCRPVVVLLGNITNYLIVRIQLLTFWISKEIRL